MTDTCYGMGIIMISSDLLEILGLTNASWCFGRVRLAATLTTSETTPDEVDN